jgi:hypothetical protein
MAGEIETPAEKREKKKGKKREREREVKKIEMI